MAGDLTFSSAVDSAPAHRLAAASDVDSAHDDLTRRVRVHRWSLGLLAVDTVAAIVAVAAMAAVRLGVSPVMNDPARFVGISSSLVLLWPVMMLLASAYDIRRLAEGFEQYRKVVNGAIWLIALAGFASFALHADVPREAIFVAIPVTGAMSLLARYLVRKALHRRLHGECVTHRVLAIGLVPDVRRLAAHMRRAEFAGFRVVAALTPGDAFGRELPRGVQWAGSDAGAAVEEARSLHADTIAVVAPHLMPEGQLRRLSWELEGTDIELVLAPAITDVAGPRIRTRPIAGLPLLCVEKPQFNGPQRVVKAAIDRALSALALLALSPLMLAVALAVRVTSAGPVLYRQQRVGAGGRAFCLLKFRSMRDGADAEVHRLVSVNEHDGVLFKIRHDPRLTSIGAFLRRWSLDELPQLWNVLKGEMSLVGPRPPLQSEVERYETDVHRRLMVKPGITGLWQVSGRSDLAWDETVRLDLHYVDNWSVGLDLLILSKTLLCVLRGDGAY